MEDREFSRYVFLVVLVVAVVGVFSTLGDDVTGAAVRARTTCTDSDGGRVLEVKGTASDTMSRTNTDKCCTQQRSGCRTVDNCEGDTCRIIEAFCRNTGTAAGVVAWTSIVRCPAGKTCQNGACVAAQVQASCIDTDGGQNLDVQGTISGVDALGVAYSSTDICDVAGGPTSLREFYCENNLFRINYIRCPLGKTCQNGACVAAQVQASCTDTDGGRNVDVQGTISGFDARGLPFSGATGSVDTCEYTRLREFYCEGNLNRSVIIPCPAGKACRNGACVQIQASCNDRDGGQNLDVATSISGFDARGLPFSGATGSVDTCLEDGRLREWYCDSNLNNSVKVQCPAGKTCQNGACVAAGFCRMVNYPDNFQPLIAYGQAIRTNNGVFPVIECKDGIVTEYGCDLTTKVIVRTSPCQSGACLNITNCTVAQQPQQFCRQEGNNIVTEAGTFPQQSCGPDVNPDNTFVLNAEGQQLYSQTSNYCQNNLMVRDSNRCYQNAATAGCEADGRNCCYHFTTLPFTCEGNVFINLTRSNCNNVVWSERKDCSATRVYVDTDSHFSDNNKCVDGVGCAPCGFRRCGNRYYINPEQSCPNGIIDNGIVQC